MLLNQHALSLWLGFLQQGTHAKTLLQQLFPGNIIVVEVVGGVGEFDFAFPGMGLFHLKAHSKVSFSYFL